jgi:hypothetical protein
VSGRRIIPGEDALVDVIGIRATFALRVAAQDARLDQLLARLSELEKRGDACGLDRRAHAQAN